MRHGATLRCGESIRAEVAPMDMQARVKALIAKGGEQNGPKLAVGA